MNLRHQPSLGESLIDDDLYVLREVVRAGRDGLTRDELKQKLFARYHAKTDALDRLVNRGLIEFTDMKRASTGQRIFRDTHTHTHALNTDSNSASLPENP